MFLENGTLLFDAYFEKFQMDSVLITGFTTAINQFGLKIFPEEDLDDIVFSKHHIFFQKFQIQGKAVIFLDVHDKNEDHFVLKRINQQIFWDLKQKYSDLFLNDLFEINQLLPLRTRVEAVFAMEHRNEKILKE
ncbi:MAG TPA: hypothetical protein VKM55_26225 [Candidatus Lokiarchaeia archaeon]|nr:hypothetical protein [Candidatus Lokiarchaeia archaeon]